MAKGETAMTTLTLVRPADAEVPSSIRALMTQVENGTATDETYTALSEAGYHEWLKQNGGEPYEDWTWKHVNEPVPPGYEHTGGEPD